MSFCPPRRLIVATQPVYPGIFSGSVRTQGRSVREGDGLASSTSLDELTRRFSNTEGEFGIYGPSERALRRNLESRFHKQFTGFSVLDSVTCGDVVIDISDREGRPKALFFGAHAVHVFDTRCDKCALREYSSASTLPLRYRHAGARPRLILSGSPRLLELPNNLMWRCEVAPTQRISPDTRVNLWLQTIVDEARECNTEVVISESLESSLRDEIGKQVDLIGAANYGDGCRELNCGDALLTFRRRSRPRGMGFFSRVEISLTWAMCAACDFRMLRSQTGTPLPARTA